MSRRWTIYTSDRDNALKASVGINSVQRLGLPIVAVPGDEPAEDRFRLAAIVDIGATRVQRLQDGIEGPEQIVAGNIQ